MKKIGKTWKISSILIMLILTSCVSNGDSCSTIEKGIVEHCDAEKSNCQISLNHIFEESFDSLYIFEGPRFPDEIEDIIKIEYDEVLDDGNRLYVFVKNRQIILKEISSCTNVDIHGLMNDQGYVVLSNDTMLYSRLKKNASGTLYRVSLK